MRHAQACNALIRLMSMSWFRCSLVPARSRQLALPQKPQAHAVCAHAAVGHDPDLWVIQPDSKVATRTCCTDIKHTSTAMNLFKLTCTDACTRPVRRRFREHQQPVTRLCLAGALRGTSIAVGAFFIVLTDRCVSSAPTRQPSAAAAHTAAGLCYDLPPGPGPP